MISRLVLKWRKGERLAMPKRYGTALKGMWMGGVPPYGYRVENRKLVVDEEGMTYSAIRLFWRFGSS